MCIFLGQKSVVYGENFLRNFKFYEKTLTKLHDLTVAVKSLQNYSRILSSCRLFVCFWSFFIFLAAVSEFSFSVFIWMCTYTHLSELKVYFKYLSFCTR
jgi:hypothetical protein